MSETKFTKGPWSHKINLHVVEARKHNGKGIDTVCELDHGGYGWVAKNEDEMHANAFLIAAAPEMYAELQDLLDAMEAGLFPQAAPGVDYPAVMEKKLELRKLLKKARGEE